MEHDSDSPAQRGSNLVPTANKNPKNNKKKGGRSWQGGVQKHSRNVPPPPDKTANSMGSTENLESAKPTVPQCNTPR